MDYSNNKFFNALIKLGEKMSKQRHLAAISKGMMSSMPLLLIGAIFQIICIIPIDIIKNNTETLMIPYNMTMGAFSIAVAFAIAYQLANGYKMRAMMSGVTSMIIFLMTVAPATTVETGLVNAEGVFEQVGSFTGLSNSYLGAQGLFVAMIVAVVTVEVSRFCQTHNVVIKLPDAVPPAMGESFTAIIPMLFSTIIFFGLNLILQATVNMSFPTAIMAALAKPLGVVNTIPAMFLVCIFAAVLWCFGIHGTIIIYPFVMPMMIMAAQSNAELVAQGLAPEFWPSMLFGTLQMVGGTGNTLGLVMLGLRSKSEQIKAVSKVALIPGWCCINEPVAFGMPIVFNPILMIPYILAPAVVFLINWGAYAIGFLKPGYISAQALMPMGFSQFIGSGMHIPNLLFPYLLIPISMLIYYPFFKVYEAQLVKKEQEVKSMELIEEK